MPKILPGETDIYAITDARLSLGRSLEEVAMALLGAGVRILQYREKRLKGGEMLEQCRLLRRLAAAADACFIVNDHACGGRWRACGAGGPARARGARTCGTKDAHRPFHP